jgi:lipopolysaccharide export system protein LptA
VYNEIDNIATLSGSVRITRGQNQLAGDVAEVNLDTGVSRLLSQTEGEGLVRGLLVPEEN